MKILIISGTPKTNGLTYSFVEAAEKTIKSENVEYETLHLVQLDLRKCKMCGDGWGICFNEHICKIGDEDGFNNLQKKFKEANAFVFISPVYWGEITEEFKIFLDRLRRCQATKQWSDRESEVSFLKGKPSILVGVAGGGGGGLLSALLDFERAITQMSGDEKPREHTGIFDYVMINRWNSEYKREAFVYSLKKLIELNRV